MEPKEQQIKSTGQITQFGQALGLDSDFLKDVELKGQAAIINRVRYIDETGAHGRLLSVVQQIGAFLDRRMMKGQPTRSEEILAAVGEMAEFHGVNKRLTATLVGAILETYQHTLGRLAKGELNANAVSASESGAVPIPSGQSTETAKTTI